MDNPRSLDPLHALQLAQVLRLQSRNDSSLDAATLFGIEHGIAEAIEKVIARFKPISIDAVERVESLLKAVQHGASPHDFTEAIRHNEPDRMAACTVMTYFLLQGSFEHEIEAVCNAPGAAAELKNIVDRFRRNASSEVVWSAGHEVLFDYDGEDGRRSFSATCATVPRVGDVVAPERGQPKIVVGVEWQIHSSPDSSGHVVSRCIPHVLLGEDEEIVPNAPAVAV